MLGGLVIVSGRMVSMMTLEQAKFFFSGAGGPAVPDGLTAAKLLSALLREADELRVRLATGQAVAPEEWAGLWRRVAYVQVMASDHNPAFRADAEDAIARWQDAETAVTAAYTGQTRI